MFGFFKRSPKRKPTPKPKAKTKLGLESLESRYAPAGDLIAGAALYNGTTPSVVFSFQAKQYSATFDVGLYQSANKTFEAANDKLIASGKASVSPTNPQGGTVSLSSPIIDDPNLPYLLVVLDPANKIGEAAGTRGNNTTVFTAPGTKGTYQGQTFVVYSGEVRLGGDRNWRNNNPGNLEYGDFAKAHGAIGTDGRFAIFSNETMGTNAVVALLKTSSYQSLTIRQAMITYARSPEDT